MTPALLQWADATQDTAFESILLGNGASRAVWDSFRYESLYAAASSGETASPLLQADIAVFSALGTKNFEQVLSGLLSADQVTAAVGVPVPEIRARYDSIRSALAAAVHHVHIPWTSTPDNNLESIGEALREYEFVF